MYLPSKHYSPGILYCWPGYDVMDDGPLRAASAAAFSASMLATTSSTSESANSLSPAKATYHVLLLLTVHTFI